MSFKAPYLSYSDVGETSKAFLEKYHPSFDLPIPIEEIIDVKIGINIFPFPRLYRDHGLNGFLTTNRETIYVDEHQYNSFYEKYRYTIAHELGHYFLHESFYINMEFDSISEYKKWRMSVPQEELDWFETQADWFAGQILVPDIQLIEICKMVVNKYNDRLSELTKIPEDFWSYASNEIARYFEVNPPVVEIRVKKAKIAEKIQILENK